MFVGKVKLRFLWCPAQHITLTSSQPRTGVDRINVRNFVCVCVIMFKEENPSAWHFMHIILCIICVFMCDDEDVRHRWEAKFNILAFVPQQQSNFVSYMLCCFFWCLELFIVFYRQTQNLYRNRITARNYIYIYSQINSSSP